MAARTRAHTGKYKYTFCAMGKNVPFSVLTTEQDGLLRNIHFHSTAGMNGAVWKTQAPTFTERKLVTGLTKS